MEDNIQTVNYAAELEQMGLDNKNVTGEYTKRRQVFDGIYQERLRALFDKYHDNFILGQQQCPKMATDRVAGIVGGEDRPFAAKPHRYNDEKRDVIQEQVNLLEDQKVIRKSMSEWASPVVLVLKPGQPGKWRLCMDLRGMNKVVG